MLYSLHITRVRMEFLKLCCLGILLLLCTGRSFVVLECSKVPNETTFLSLPNVTKESDLSTSENPETREAGYTATENPYGNSNTKNDSTTEETKYNSTESLIGNVAMETDDEEFVFIDDDFTCRYEVSYELCNHLSSKTSFQYRPLFFYNLKEDADHFLQFLEQYQNRSSFQYEDTLEVWTDYHDLNTTFMISNHTGHVVNITHGKLKPYSSTKIDCFILDVKTFINNSLSQNFIESLERKPCHSTVSVICRAVNMSTGVTTTMNRGGPASTCPVCDCDCDASSEPSTTLTEEEVEAVVRDIRRNLTVVRANLSSSIRKRISASDPRMSSRIIGMTLGVTILSLSASLLVIPDILSVLKFLVSKVCGRV